MDIDRINIYKRLRDFKVPSSILDNIFSKEKDFSILKEAFKSLTKDGCKEDQAAEIISKMIFKELDIKPDHSTLEEK